MNNQVTVSFRMPVKLAALLEVSAERSRRSMNAEMIVRLEHSFHLDANSPVHVKTEKPVEETRAYARFPREVEPNFKKK